MSSNFLIIALGNLVQHSYVYDFGSCYKLCSAQKQLLLGFLFLVF